MPTTHAHSQRTPLDHRAPLLLDGRKAQVSLPGGVVKPGQETRLPGEGMPIRKGGANSKGDLLVKWEVVFPERLTTAQKEGLKKVLG